MPRSETVGRRVVTLPRLILTFGLIGVGAAASEVLREGVLAPLSAAPPVKPAVDPAPAGQPASSNKAQMPVAYIYGNIPIRLGELQDYLVARFGAEHLPFLVNRRIIEHACAEKGIRVDEAEIDRAVDEDIATLGVTKEAFVNTILKRHKKSLYQWREDVVRPKLLMAKYCRDQVRIEPKDLESAYEAYFGEKAVCRMIMWPKKEKKRIEREIYPKIRDSEKGFDEEARKQESISLAREGGKLPPIGRNTTGDDTLEKEIFALQPGEITPLIESGEWVVVVKCDQRIPAIKEKPTEQQRARIEKEIMEKKLQQKIQETFKELRQKANPDLIVISKDNPQEFRRDIERFLAEEGELPPVKQPSR